jgi:transposase
VGIVERLVPDDPWELFQRVVPEAPIRPQGGGRRRHGDREVLAAIVFVATSGCTWQQLPSASFGPSGATAHRRFAEWSKARVWAKLHRLVLDELGVRGELGAEAPRNTRRCFEHCARAGAVGLRGQVEVLAERGPFGAPADEALSSALLDQRCIDRRTRVICPSAGPLSVFTQLTKKQLGVDRPLSGIVQP